MIVIWRFLHWAFGWHHWRVINPTEDPADVGRTYKQCVVCELYCKEIPCWVSTLRGGGYTNGWYRSFSRDGKAWTEPVKVV